MATSVQQSTLRSRIQARAEAGDEDAKRVIDACNERDRLEAEAAKQLKTLENKRAGGL